MTVSARAAAARAAPLAEWTLSLPRGRSLVLGKRPLVMGVLNVTPDSFSDGDLYLEPQRAVERGLRLLAQGADILDIGAESTRPGGGVYGKGASEVTPEAELERLLPALRGLRRETDRPLSVDTRKAEVAREAIAAGADLINDISCLGDPHMAPLVARRGVPVVLMHSRGELRTMQRDIHFEDVVGEVVSELEAALHAAENRGVAKEQTLLDPGIGFGKTQEQNLQLLRRLDRLSSLGRPLLIGASRKSFIGRLTGQPPRERVAGSLAAAAWALARGAHVLRVHDVEETVRFVRVWSAIGAIGKVA